VQLRECVVRVSRERYGLRQESASSGFRDTNKARQLGGWVCLILCLQWVVSSLTMTCRRLIPITAREHNARPDKESYAVGS